MLLGTPKPKHDDHPPDSEVPTPAVETHLLGQIDFATALPFTRVLFSTCLPLPGTTSFQRTLEKHGLGRIDWSTYDFDTPTLLPCAATPAELRRMLHKANMRIRHGLGKVRYWLRSRLLGRV